MAAPVAHGQPPAIRVFCEGLIDGIFDCCQRHPTTILVSAIAFTVLGIITVCTLSALFPAVTALTVIANLSVLAIMLAGNGAILLSGLRVEHPGTLLVAVVAFTILGIGISLAAPVMIPGAVTTIIADSAFVGILSTGANTSVILVLNLTREAIMRRYLAQQ